MKIVSLRFVWLVFAAFAPLAHSGPSLRPLPPLLRTVSDEVGALTISEGQALSRTLADIESKTRVKMIVLIAETVLPETIEAYVQRLVNHWRARDQLPSHDRFIFVVVAKNDRALRVVPGRELSWVLKPFNESEAAAGAPLLLKENKYYEALTVIATQLFQLIGDRGRVVLIPTNPTPSIRTVGSRKRVFRDVTAS